jgi:Lon protease-like protein
VYGDLPRRFEDATWVGMRLAEILPLSLPERQRCLEMMDALARLDFVRERLDAREH